MAESLKEHGVWRNRIKGYGEMKPEEFLANPENWRVHPRFQQDAMVGILNEVGWVQNVIVNVTTGHLVDGHLRVLVADRNNDQAVPVTFVELTIEEEAKVLATLDPLAALAVSDKEKVEELFAGLQWADDDLAKLAEQTMNEADLWPDSLGEPDLPPLDDPGDPSATVSFKVQVTNPDSVADAKTAIRLLIEDNPEWGAGIAE